MTGRSHPNVPKGLALVLLCALAVLPLSIAGTAAAADVTKVGWVRAQSVLEGTAEGARIRSQSDEYIAARQKIVDLEQRELETLEKQLKDQSTLLSDQARAGKEAEFRRKLDDYREKVSQMAVEIERKQAELLGSFSKTIKEAAQKVARRDGYAYVFDSPEDGVLIYADPAHDLTDKVIAELNAAAKSPQ
ncbi:MAG: OmpH family outer membrane protein [Nitrospirota bacterium]|nr:OmpH family outer membrane protein [Nitrospirota bacterium]